MKADTVIKWISALVTLMAILYSVEGQISTELEPPRPSDFQFLGFAASELRERRIKDTKANKKRGSNKYGNKGKNQYISEVKNPITSETKVAIDKTVKNDNKETVAATENKDGIKCVKIDKKNINADAVFGGRFKRAAMTCFKCEDMKNGGTYEKCSMGNDPNNSAFFETHQKSYSTKEKPKDFKFDGEKGDGAESRVEYSSSPSAEYLAAASGVGKYNYGEYDTSEDKIEPKGSDYAITTKKIEPAQKYSHRSTEPKVTYTYQTHQETPEEETKYEPKSTEYSFSSSKKLPTTSYSYETTDKPVSYSYTTDTDDYTPKSSEFKFSSEKTEPKKKYSYETTDKPIGYSYHNEKINDRPGKSEKYDSTDQGEPSEYSFSKSYDEPLKVYHESSSYDSKDEPKQQTRQHRNHQPAAATTKKSKFVSEPSDELKKALGEFHAKDRTNCEKIKKDVMTCWVCKDESGAQQEECMYVANAEPKKHATAYSDVKQVKRKPEQVKQERRINPSIDIDSYIEQSDVQQKVQKREPAPVKETPSTYIPAPISPFRQAARRDAQKTFDSFRSFDDDDDDNRRNSKTPIVQQAEAHATQNKPKTSRSHNKKDDERKPVEFEVEGTDGAFSAETREVFDKTLGLTLPKYMTEKSIHEQMFDEVVSSGRR